MIFKIILLIVLILVNGIFSATEIAFLSINKYELNKEIKKNNKKAFKIAALIEDSSTFLSAIQIAITLSGFLASAFAAENFASEIASTIPNTMFTEETLTSILIVIITMILSYFTLVFGELVPKKIGLAHSKSISFGMVGVIEFVINICRPFIFILKVSTDFVIKIFKVEKKEESVEEELKSTIIDSSLEELEKKLLLNVFQFNDTTVEQVMTKKEDVITIDIDISKEKLFNIIKEQKYTRFPVTKNGEVIGILNVKDFIIKQNEKFLLKNYVRKIVKLDNTTIIDDAFFYLNSNHEPLAKVEKDGKYVGIVTIEDIIEDLIGNIFDEYDDKEEKENNKIEEV